jgi:hypothetical protein
LILYFFPVQVEISSPPLKNKEVVLFFLTMYHNLSLHAEIVLGGRPRTKADRVRYYQQLSYTIAGQRFSLDTIEQILRGILSDSFYSIESSTVHSSRQAA